MEIQGGGSNARKFPEQPEILLETRVATWLDFFKKRTEREIIPTQFPHKLPPKFIPGKLSEEVTVCLQRAGPA